MDKLLDQTMVLGRLGISRSTLLRWISAGHFPEPIRLGPRVHRWSEAEIDLWFQRLKGGTPSPPEASGRDRR